MVIIIIYDLFTNKILNQPSTTFGRSRKIVFESSDRPKRRLRDHILNWPQSNLLNIKSSKINESETCESVISLSDSD